MTELSPTARRVLFNLQAFQQSAVSTCSFQPGSHQRTPRQTIANPCAMIHAPSRIASGVSLSTASTRLSLSLRPSAACLI